MVVNFSRKIVYLQSWSDAFSKIVYFTCLSKNESLSWLHQLKLGWIPRDFLYSRMMVLELFCWYSLKQLFLLFLLSRKIFWKNHKFSLKSHFFWKRDEFERDFLGLLGWDYAHSKENFSLYQNRHIELKGENVSFACL